jgi:hypothetical protein
MHSFRLWTRLWIVVLAVVAVLAVVSSARAQAGPRHLGSSSPTKEVDRPQGASAPVPPALVNAKAVFVSNAGADAGLFPHPFTGTQDRGYGYFYSALANSGRFTLVDSPAAADVVMTIELSSPLGPQGDNKQKGTADPLPTFKLTVYDRPSHYVLWTITQTVDPANLQKTHDKNFDSSIDSIVTQLIAISK